MTHQQQSSGHPPREANSNGGVTLAPTELAEPWGAEELAATLNSVATGIWALDLDGRCVFINQAACRILGYVREECLGRYVQCMIHRGNHEAWICPKDECPLRRALESRSAASVDDDVFYHRDGTSLSVRFSVQPVVARGRMAGVVVSFTDTTAQKCAEEARRKSDEWLGLAQNAAGVGIFDLDLKTGEARISEEQFRIFGLNPAGKGLSVEGWRELVHPEDRERMDRQHQLARSGTQPPGEEYRVVWPDGSVHWLFGQPKVFFDEAGKPTRVVGTNLNVTGRVQAETALNQFFAASPSPLAIWSLDGRIQRSNPAWEPILGFAPAELDGLPAFDLVHPSDLAAATAEFSALLISKKRAAFECRVRCKDGSYRWLLLDSAVPKGLRVIYVTAQDITERKAAEGALAESEEKFRELFDSAPVAYHELDKDGVLRRVNRAECALLGYEPGEMLGRPVWEFIASAEREASRESIRQGLSGDQALEPIQRRFVTRGGADLWIEIHATLVRDAEGGTAGIRAALVDVTERKRAEEALRESREVLQAVLNSVPVRVFWKDSNLLYLGCNPPFARDAGFEKPEDIIGKDDRDMVWREQAERYRADDRAVFESGAAKLLFEEPQTTASGERIHLLTSKVPLRDAGGEIVGVLGTYFDVTDRKRNEEKLLASEKRNRSIIETAMDGFWRVDTEGRLLEVNEAYCRMSGYSPRELLAMRIPDLVDAELESKVDARTQQAIAMGEHRFESRHRRKDGSAFEVEVSVQYKSADGGQMVVFLRDITERKRMEEAIRAHSEKLARSNAELERFAYVASHDLQEPLRMVASFTQLLSRRYSGKLDETADRYIEYAVDGAKRMQQLIADLLLYSRVNSKELDLRPAGCEAVVQGAMRSLQAAIEESGALVDWDPLPALCADQAQLTQLFQNLLGNALKFTRKGERPLVHISAADNGVEWLFSVRDNGIGIDPAQTDRVFQIFQRLHTRAEYQGTGIGLAICQKVVERHGGKIWVESEPGVGSTFRFTIPKPMENRAEDERTRQTSRDTVN